MRLAFLRPDSVVRLWVNCVEILAELRVWAEAAWGLPQASTRSCTRAGPDAAETIGSLIAFTCIVMGLLSEQFLERM